MNQNLRVKLLALAFLLMESATAMAQLDYSRMENWAFHPNKMGTALPYYNLDIAVVNENLSTTKVISIPNNSRTNTGVDVFFIHPTILDDLGAYSGRQVIPLAEQPSRLISGSIIGQAGLLSKYGRFFAPRYRQASPPTYLMSPMDATQALVIGEAYKDIKASFLNYLTYHNKGNRIIIASHSQGAYLASILLHDVFDPDTALRRKLVTAVIAGIAGNYAHPSSDRGGWWQNIPLCKEQNECGCVTTWRSYKEGQTLPPVQPSSPSLNPHLVQAGLVYRKLDLNEDRVAQDSLYYSDRPAYLRYYILPKTNQSYGGAVGFLAFDSLYQVRHLRTTPTRTGFAVDYRAKPNDQRPNDLVAEEQKPLFSAQGYHFKDYNIYIWALMEQIDRKLAAYPPSATGGVFPDADLAVQVHPNPAANEVTLQSQKFIFRVEVFNATGQVVKRVSARSREVHIELQEIASGPLLLRLHLEDGGSETVKLIKL